MLTLTWDSREGQTYAVKASTDLMTWDADLDDSIEADAGDTTTRVFAVGIAPVDGKLFFRVERN
jgi:hypothetical protein